MELPNSEFQYLYRDASNYKSFGSVVVSGRVQVTEVRPHLHEDLYFLPQLVGLEALQFDTPSEDDHLWHELVTIVPSGEEAVLEGHKLLQNFAECRRVGWERCFHQVITTISW